MSDLTFDGQDIRQAAAKNSGSGIFFDLVSGYFEPASVRGVDTVIPSAAGRIERDRVKDARRIMLHGFVTGTSASDWNTNTSTLMGVMDPSASGATLAIGTGYLGVASGKSITARVVNLVGGEIVAQRFQTWDIELESIDPDWA